MSKNITVAVYAGIKHGTGIWEVARKANHANSSSVYDEFIGNGAKHRKNSSIVQKRRNCLKAQSGLNQEEPSEWVVDNLFEPGKLGEKRFLELTGGSITPSSYYRCFFNDFRVGVSPDGQYGTIPFEIKTNCRGGKRWDTPPLKTYVQNMFQCIALGSDRGAIVRIEENDEDYLDFTAWVVNYDIPKFVDYFSSLIDQVKQDQTFSANQTELLDCIDTVWTMPNQVYLTGQPCYLFDSLLEQ